MLGLGEGGTVARCVDDFSASHCEPSDALAADRLSGDAGPASRRRTAAGAVIRVDSTGRTKSCGG